MIREIKFRLWYHNCVMEYRADDWYIDLHGDLFCFDSDTESYEKVNRHFSYEIMQYTGLKDKHGKEIYKGDILDFGGLRPIEIRWGECGFKSRLIPFDNSEPIHLTQIGMSEFGEVIGNIYENTELIK